MLKRPSNGRRELLDDQEHIAPRPTGAQGSILLAPVTPPCYLTTNQSGNGAQADHAPLTPLPYLAFKNASLKPIMEFRSFEHEPPVLLAWPLQ